MLCQLIIDFNAGSAQGTERVLKRSRTLDLLVRRRSCVHGEHSKGPKPLRAPPGHSFRRALENLFCTKCHCQVPLPHNSAPPPRATKSRIANGAEHRPRWVLRHRGAAGAGASRSQVKVQTRRITGPAPRPRRYKRLRVGDMRRTFSNPALKNSLGSLGEAAIQSHAKRRRPACGMLSFGRLKASNGLPDSHRCI